MKRIMTLSLVTLILIGMAAGVGAFYSPVVYSYLQSQPDTLVAKKVYVGAGAYDTTRIVRKVAGVACTSGIDTLGVGDRLKIKATAAAVCSLFTNGYSTPTPITLQAARENDILIRWIDSLIVKDGGAGSTVYVEQYGHKAWFSQGGSY